MKALPTLRQLSYLAALAEHRHFGRAAEACLVTQSTLSAGLQELEGLLGVTLVERTKRRMMLTPLGEEMVSRARAMLQAAEDMVDIARAAAEPLSAELRLGMIPTIGPYLLPRVMPLVRDEYPKLKLYLREDLTARLLDQLDRGLIDVALIALPYPAEDLETVVVGEDPFLLVCPPGHSLVEQRELAPQDLATAGLLLLEDGHCLRDHALAACHLAGGGEGFRGTSLHTIVQMVANGLGVTLLPRLALDGGILRGSDLVTRDLEQGAPARQIGLAWRRSSPRKIEFHLLADLLRRVLAAPAVKPRENIS